ncbi:MAG: SpoIIE family protein phosphatase [Bacteroidetes bacterium]|nr:SpoIIE family protein phosphatase [Bacteroidota bacterium]
MFQFFKRLKPSQKIVLTVFTGLLVLSTYFVVNTYISFLDEAEKNALKRLEAIANTVAFQIDGDKHQIIANRYSEPGQLTSNTDDSIYYELWKPLKHAHEANHLESEIATLILNDDMTMDYIMNSLDSPYVRDPYEDYDQEFLDYYKTGGVIHQYTDEFGTWLTALAPVKDSKGNVVAMVEVDAMFDVFIAEAHAKLFKNLVITFGIFLLIAIVMLRLVRQIARADEEAKRKIEESNQIITQKNKDILDSINYAKRIQSAILAPKEEIFAVFDNCFILYKPKDIVSGDFYYFSNVEGHGLIAAADCTGHGVPGALMSMIGNDLLNHITRERKVTNPAEALDLLHKGITNVLKQDGRHGETRDGMDIALLSFDLKNKNRLQYAGAYRALCMVRDGEMIEYKANKFPIGNASMERGNFTNNEIEVRSGDMCYFFTDGYADQFGGDQGKKFMMKKFHRLLVEVSTLPISEQEKKLDEAIETWRGDHEQVDDILVIGIRI